MTIELPETLEIALKVKALSLGTSTAMYVRDVLERELDAPLAAEPVKPFKNSRGMLAKYGPAPTAEEIDENRREMLRGTIFDPDVK